MCTVFHIKSLKCTFISFQGKFEMSWLNILSMDFILFTLSLLSLLFLWVELFEISFMIARWEPQCFLLYRLLLTTTGINWQRLHIFYRDWNWQRLPGPMAYRYHIVSEKMDQCPISGYSNECSREKWENTHPCRKISIFTILKLRHCYLVSWLHI